MWNTLKKLIHNNVGPKKQELHKSSFLANDFALTHLSESFGTPSQVTRVAFDPIQKICAIGGAGGIKIFGKVGAEVTLKSDVTSPLVQLFFIANEGILVCIYETTIQTWNIAEKKILLTHQLISNCTSARYIMGSKFVLIGNVRGCVTSFNLESNYHSSYLISYLEHVTGNDDVKLPPRGLPAVLSVDVNPMDNTQILVAFTNSVIVLFDANARKGTKCFSAPDGITCLTFNRNGGKFATGHRSGEVALWNTKDSTAKVSFFISDSESERRPVKHLVWAKSKGENYLILIGGANAPGVPSEGERERPVHQREGITVVSGKKLRKNADRKRLWYIEPASGNVVDFTLGFNSPWPNQLERDLQFMVSVTDNGKIMAHNLTKSGFIEISSPSTQLLFGDPLSTIVYCRVYKDCSASLFAVLRSTSQYKPSDDWPITGGSVAASIPGRELLVTGHADGKIHFWHADVASFSHLYTLAVSSNPRQFEFSPASGRLLVIYDNVVQFYNLSVSARVIKTLVYDPTFSQQTTQVPSPQAEPSTQTSSPPPQPPSSPIQASSSPVQTLPAVSAPSSPQIQQQQQQQQQQTGSQQSQPTQPSSPRQQSPEQVPLSQSHQAIPQSQQLEQPQQSPQPQQPQQQSQQLQHPKTPAFFRPAQHFSAGFQLEGEFFMGSTVTSAHISEDNRFVIGEENGFAASLTFHDNSEVPIKIMSHKKITEGTAISLVNSFGPTSDFPNISQQIAVCTQTGSIGIFDSTSHQCAATFRVTENSPIIYFQIVDRFGVPVSQRQEIPPESVLASIEEPVKSRTRGESNASPPATPMRNLQISGENLLPNPAAPPSAPSSTPSSPTTSPTPDISAQQRMPDSSVPPSQLPPSSTPSTAPSTPSSSAPTSPSITPIPLPLGELYAVVASEKEIHVFQRTLQEHPDDYHQANLEAFTYERVAKTEVKTKLYNVAIFKYFGNNEACLAAFDINGGIHLYTLLDLTRVHSISYQATNVRFTPGPEGVIYGMHPEGVLKASVFAAEFRPPAPVVFVQGITAPAAPKAGVFKSLFGKQVGGLDDLLGQRETQAQEASKAQAQAQPQPQQGPPQQGTRSIEEIKAKYGRSTTSTSDALNQAKQALGERGEKLAELSDKTADMEVASQDFLENIKKLKEKQNSSWW